MVHAGLEVVQISPYYPCSQCDNITQHSVSPLRPLLIETAGHPRQESAWVVYLLYIFGSDRSSMSQVTGSDSLTHDQYKTQN